MRFIWLLAFYLVLVTFDTYAEEKPVTASDIPLRGTLTYTPEKKRPLAILIPGSGPLDRNGNSPLGLKGSIYKQLTDGLDQAGISTFVLIKEACLVVKLTV